MKILFPIGTFYPAQLGGPNNSVFAISKALVKKGHEVYVVTTDHGITDNYKVDIGEWNDIEGVKVFYGTRKIPFLNKSIPNNFKKLFYSIIKHVDVIHLTSFFTPLSHYSALLARKNGLPYVWSPHGELSENAINSKALKKKLFLKLPLVKSNFKNAFFHVTGGLEKSWLKNFLNNYFGNYLDFKDQIFSIPNAINNSIIANLDEKKSLIDNRYILFLGRINPIKNIGMLIKSFSKFAKRKNIILVIVGDTNDDLKYFTKLKNLARKLNVENKVIFTKERVEGDEKLALYKNAELFVLPSHSENFGMVVLESLAQGTPVISTRNTPWEQLEEYNCGYWIEKNENALKIAIEEYFNLNEIEKDKMSENAIALARNFSSDIIGKEYLEMYSHILNDFKLITNVRKEENV